MPEKLKLASPNEVERIVREAVQNKGGWHNATNSASSAEVKLTPEQPKQDQSNTIDNK